MTHTWTDRRDRWNRDMYMPRPSGLDKIFFPWTKHFVQRKKHLVRRTKLFFHGQNILSDRQNVLSMDKMFCPIQKDGALDLPILRNGQIWPKNPKNGRFLNFSTLSSHYHFWWFSGPFRPFFLKNGKKSEFQLFWLIFRKMALAMPKWPSETPGMGQMASFWMVFNPKMYCRVYEKV